MNLYRLDASANLIATTFGAAAGEDPWTGGYVAPGHPAPIIVGDGRGGSRLFLRPKLWGVAPPPRGTQPVTHVRNLESPFWIGTLRHPELRCLIPATSFALWSGPAGVKQQKWISLTSRPLFAFAGIHRQGEDWPSFAMVTTNPNRLVEHHRPGPMPVILDAENHERWLAADWREAKSLVVSYPSQLMTTSDTPPQ